jgi:hypothetical protein
MSLGLLFILFEGLWYLQFETKSLLRLLVLEDKGDMIFQNIRNITPTIQFHIPEDLNLHHLHSENLESCVMYVCRVCPVTGCLDYLQPVHELIVVRHKLHPELNMANIWTRNINHLSFLGAKTPSN